MAIRIIGANPRTITAAMILEAAKTKRIKDSATGTPLQIVMLYWNNQKKTYHESKTKGDWDDVFITRSGSGGLVLEYRHPGSLEWLKDPIAGDYSASCAITERNMFLLASHYYDRLWTIGDPVIDAKAKAMADKIDEDNKKIPTVFTKIYKRINPKNGQYESIEEKVEGNMYQYHKYRREMNFKSHSEYDSIAIASTTPTPISNAMDDLLIREKNLREREAAIEERERNLGIVQPANAVPNLPLTQDPGFSAEELTAMRIQDLRKFAKDKFKIDALKLSKAAIIEEIQKIQINPPDTPAEEMVSPAEVRQELVEEERVVD